MDPIWSDIGLYLGIAVGLVLLSGFFSGTEVALFALRRIDREQMARSSRPVDRQVLALLAQPRKLIATVLIGNETIHATIAAVAVLAVGDAIPAADRLARAAIAVAIALPVVVLLGEVTAKTVALKSPMGWSRATARSLYVLAIVLAPIRWIVHGLADVVLMPLGAAARSRPARDLSEEEFRTLVDAGSAQGQVDARERRIIHRVFEFSDKNVGQVMTPRDKIVALSYDLPMARLIQQVSARGFSRIPIYQKSLDNVRGVLNAKDLVPAMAGQAVPRSLADLLHEPLFVPRTTPIKRLFRVFKQRKVHLAIVVNEYGKVLGLVTMDDLLAQLFGAIRDEREGQQQAASRGRGGRTPVPVAPGAAPATEADPAAPDDDGGSYADLTPPPLADPQEAARALRDLAELEDDRTPPPVEVRAPRARPTTAPEVDDDGPVAGDAPVDDAAPVPVEDVVTGPSGPIKAAHGGGEP
jgi:putative hemolysin